MSKEDRLIETALVLSKKIRVAAEVIPDCIQRLEALKNSCLAIPIQTRQEICRLLVDLKSLTSREN